MAQRVQRAGVTLTATCDIDLEPGVRLPPGTYAGIREQIGLETLEGVSWAKPSYSVELTGAQLANIAPTTAKRNVISTRYDVTRFVRSGDIVA